MLKKFEFKSSYNRIDHDIAKEFYLPCMSNSIIFNRISGYFGSSVYVIAWDALKDFINRKGIIRLVCSPILSTEDLAAMLEGDKARCDKILSLSLEKELNNLLCSADLKLPAKLLTCLISQNILHIKLAIVQDKAHPEFKKIFHDKIGIFVDEENNAVGFRGSFNETYKGLSNDGNIESTDVFQSWDNGKDSIRVTDALDLFERVWAGKVGKGIQILDIPDAAKLKLSETAKQYQIEELLDEIQIRKTRASKWQPSSKSYPPRDHQIEALENWVKANRIGIFKHATGSGKTYTAICAINDALKQHETVLVFVPSKELLYHWKKEIQNNIDMDIRFLLCGDGNNLWKENKTLSLWSSKSLDTHKVIIVMMPTASNPLFLKEVSAGPHLFVVADEVHRLGSEKRRKLFTLDSGARLGLSATPERYGDPDGTEALFDYFGSIIKPEFSLENAIAHGVLTPYFYRPYSVYLSDCEQECWDLVSAEISQIIARNTENGSIPTDLFRTNIRLSQLAIKRARILKNASAKIDAALNILKEYYRQGQKWIIYCDNIDQLRIVRQCAEAAGYDAYEYYAEMAGDRDTTLAYFSRFGGIIVSIRCLDEGVDIPSTTHAMILASSKNPREFIQRRGRILRRSQGKNFAYLFDVVVLPNNPIDMNDQSLVIILNELARAIQFGKWADNKKTCAIDLELIALKYGVNYLDFLAGGIEDEER